MPSSSERSISSLPLDQIVLGDCVEVLRTFPDRSVDLIFADPPYNLQLREKNTLLRPNQTKVEGVTESWDRFISFADYDAFTEAWLSACRRVLKDDGTIWVIGTYHNIYRVGKILMDLGYWVLNDIIWYKTNAMPNFLGTRFQNATETLLWAKRSKEQSRYTFHYHAMKHLADGRQMQNVWHIPLCTGAERLKVVEGGTSRKVHSTQKPEALLYRVLLASSNPGDVVLDPFFGTGTTGVVAKQLGRHYIGIEQEPAYVEMAQRRLEAVVPFAGDAELLVTRTRWHEPRVTMGQLLENGYLQIGQRLYSRDRRVVAVIKADSHLRLETGNEKAFEGSIHQVAAQVQSKPTFNGWDYWYYEDEQGQLISIDVLRQVYRRAMEAPQK